MKNVPANDAGVSRTDGTTSPAEIPTDADANTRANTDAKTSTDGEASATREIGGRGGPDPTRYGDWEKNGRCIDF